MVDDLALQRKGLHACGVVDVSLAPGPQLLCLVLDIWDLDYWFETRDSSASVSALVVGQKLDGQSSHPDVTGGEQIRDVDANVEIRDFIFSLLIPVPHRLRMCSVQLDEVTRWVHCLLADHVEEGIYVGRVIGETGADFGAVDIVG